MKTAKGKSKSLKSSIVNTRKVIAAKFRKLNRDRADQARKVKEQFAPLTDSLNRIIDLKEQLAENRHANSEGRQVNRNQVQVNNNHNNARDVEQIRERERANVANERDRRRANQRDEMRDIEPENVPILVEEFRVPAPVPAPVPLAAPPQAPARVISRRRTVDEVLDDERSNRRRLQIRLNDIMLPAAIKRQREDDQFAANIPKKTETHSRKNKHS